MWSFGRGLALTLLASALGITVPTRAADSFSFTTIDVPAAKSTSAHGINDAGQIVGYFTDTGGKEHGFLRTSDGTFTTIDVPDATLTRSQGINGAGQIVGGFEDAGKKFRGFLRTSDGTFTTIDVPGATETEADGINASGQIVGYFTSGKGGHGFLRTPDGTFTTIDGAKGINDAGQIVGVFFDERNRKIHGFLRTADGTLNTFDVPGPTFTLADGINASGQIVGYFCNASGGQGVGTGVAFTCDHGFLRTPDGTFTPIDVPGANFTTAHGINASGQIVGTFSDAGGKRHGFVATR